MVEDGMESIENILEKLKEINHLYRTLDEFFTSSLKEGVSYKKLIEEAEEKIVSQGAGLAFPLNFSVNNIAAHDTAMENDLRELKDGDVVKVDIGIHNDGYIIDSAKTYVVGSNDEGLAIKELSEEIIKEIKKQLRLGMKINEIGEIVESIVSKEGRGIVVNLTGHNIDRYVVHGGLSILNIKNDNEQEIKYGDSIAIEPFITSLSSNISVRDHKRVEIYEMQNPSAKIRDRNTIILWNEIKRKYSYGLPFAKRWLTSLKGFLKEKALNELVRTGALYQYPVLYYPQENIYIAQSEISVYFTDKPHIFGFEF